METVRVRVPAVADLGTALRIYYEKNELGTFDIRKLFGKVSDSTVSKLKKLARAKMAEREIPSWDNTKVNTEAAFESWGLDIKRIERNEKKLRELMGSG